MPLDGTASTVVSSFGNAPEPAKGLVRDLRVRWACEEIGHSYRPELIDVFQPRPEGYRDWQPFGQVPAFDDGDVRIFESGAILLYLANEDERLPPREPQARWEATAWMIAALNSVEPEIFPIFICDVIHADKEWAEPARQAALQLLLPKLESLSKALDGKEWLVEQFTVADIMMVTVLRNLKNTNVLDDFQNLVAYRQRGEARPAFQQALSDQLAGLEKSKETGD